MTNLMLKKLGLSPSGKRLVQTVHEISSDKFDNYYTTVKRVKRVFVPHVVESENGAKRSIQTKWTRFRKTFPAAFRTMLKTSFFPIGTLSFFDGTRVRIANCFRRRYGAIGSIAVTLIAPLGGRTWRKKSQKKKKNLHKDDKYFHGAAGGGGPQRDRRDPVTDRADATWRRDGRRARPSIKTDYSTVSVSVVVLFPTHAIRTERVLHGIVTLMQRQGRNSGS